MPTISMPLKSRLTHLTVVLLAALFAVPVAAQEAADEPLRFICIGAHPDDCDVKMGGTAALLAEAGHAVKFVSVTNGDAGHFEEGGGMLAKRRRAEAQEAGRRLGLVEYEVLDNHDGQLTNNLHVREQLQRIIRAFDADVVFAPRPNDYHPDHRYTGEMVQDVAYLTIVPNVTPDTPPLEENPVFFYLSDHFQKPYPFTPTVAIGVDEAMDDKVNAMDAHVSQFYEWLPWTGGRLDEVPEDPAARKAWLREGWSRPVPDDIRAALVRWYGDEEGRAFEQAEAFEIGEYGRQPSGEEMRDIFPMLGE